MKQNKNLPFFIGIAIAAGIIIGSFLNIKNAGRAYYPISSDKKQSKIKEVLDFIESKYVDDVDAEKITDNVITEILSKLDPHSTYIPKEVQQHTKEKMDGNFVGIGVQFVIKKDSVVVAKVLPDGPSKKSGLLAGDRILMADKDTLFGSNITSKDVVKKLKGVQNSQVLVKVFRPAVKKAIDFNIARGKIAIKSVPVAYKLTDSLGYIKLIRFSMTSYQEFKTALDTLQKQGIKNLVLDLRGNPGGFMHVADQIADEFLANGKLIVYTKSKNRRQKNSVATHIGSFEKGHVYVLVDQNSASASEIISGALQDNDRGTIIGRRTFGKGLVQQELGFKDGSAMRLTTARYYTPTGRSIQKPYGDEFSYQDEIINRYKSGELFEKDSIKVVDSLKYKTPKGKIVYGGGGITPDIFIPLDTINVVNYYEQSLISNFVYEYVDEHRKELSKYNEATLEQSFKITPDIKKAFDKFMNPHQIENPKKVLDLLKESFANNLLENDEVYYKLLQKRDPYILKVKYLDQQ